MNTVTEPGLMPILLFTVLKPEAKRGVYYIPQRGLGLEGVRADGSVCSIAKHITSARFTSFEAGIINPGELTEESIIAAINTWMTKGDKLDDPAGLSEADEDEETPQPKPRVKESYELDDEDEDCDDENDSDDDEE